MRLRAWVVVLLFVLAALRVADIVVVRATWASTERYVATGALGATDVASAAAHLENNAAWSAAGVIAAVTLAVLLLTRVRFAVLLTRTLAGIVLGLYLLALAVWALQRQALGGKIDGRLIRNYTVLPMEYLWCVAIATFLLVIGVVVAASVPRRTSDG